MQEELYRLGDGKVRRGETAEAVQQDESQEGDEGSVLTGEQRAHILGTGRCAENDSFGLNPLTGITVPTSLGSQGVIFISRLPVAPSASAVRGEQGSHSSSVRQSWGGRAQLRQRNRMRMFFSAMPSHFAPPAPRGPSQDHRRPTVGRVWIGTMDPQPLRPTSRR